MLCRYIHWCGRDIGTGTAQLETNFTRRQSQNVPKRAMQMAPSCWKGCSSVCAHSSLCVWHLYSLAASARAPVCSWCWLYWVPIQRSDLDTHCRFPRFIWKLELNSIMLHQMFIIAMSGVCVWRERLYPEEPMPKKTWPSMVYGYFDLSATVVPTNLTMRVNSNHALIWGKVTDILRLHRRGNYSYSLPSNGSTLNQSFSSASPHLGYAIVLLSVENWVVYRHERERDWMGHKHLWLSQVTDWKRDSKTSW